MKHVSLSLFRPIVRSHVCTVQTAWPRMYVLLNSQAAVDDALLQLMST